MRRAAGIVALVLAAGAIAVAVSGAGDGGEARVDRWVQLRSAVLARTEVAAARVGRSIYVVGGFVRAGNATTAAVERYDISGNRWARVRSMPLGLNHPAATTYKGDVYVVGGYTADNALAGETAAFLRYEPARNRWSRLSDMPTRRAALAVGVIGDRLYAAGGATSGGTTFKRLEVFDFKARRWSRGPDMQVPREHIAGAVSGGGFYVLGGRPGNLAVAERYVPARRRWERLPDLGTARSGIAAATVGRLVVVFGGERSEGTIRPVEAFDPRTRRWRSLPGMRTPRHGLGGASLGRRVYSLEGGPQPGFAFSRALEALGLP
jgi:N-acetylneuraminic acid mutarotase